MGHKFADILFSEPVKAMQSAMNSRANFAKWETRQDFNNRIDERVATFVAARDSFYLGSVSPDGWPYIQHRGGPLGFLKVLDDKHLGFVDYSGNRQYISAGHFTVNDRVSLFLMDYPNQRRLKILGHIAQVDPANTELLVRLADPEYPAQIERAYIITVAAFDWNCSQHITPRFDSRTIQAHIAPLLAELAELKKKTRRNNSGELMSTLNIHHLGLAVKHLEATTQFFVQVLGFSIVREVPDYPARFISNGKTFLTLWQTDSDTADFNRRKAVGLHHFALAVDSIQALSALFEKARLFPGVRIDFSPEELGTSGASHCMLFEPSGVRLELIWAG